MHRKFCNFIYFWLGNLTDRSYCSSKNVATNTEIWDVLTVLGKHCSPSLTLQKPIPYKWESEWNFDFQKRRFIFKPSSVNCCFSNALPFFNKKEPHPKKKKKKLKPDCLIQGDKIGKPRTKLKIAPEFLTIDLSFPTACKTSSLLLDSYPILLKSSHLNLPWWASLPRRNPLNKHIAVVLLSRKAKQQIFKHVSL